MKEEIPVDPARSSGSSLPRLDRGNPSAARPEPFSPHPGSPGEEDDPRWPPAKPFRRSGDRRRLTCPHHPAPRKPRLWQHSPNGLSAAALSRLGRAGIGCAAAVILVAGQVASSASAQSAPDCLPPLPPLPVYDAALRAEYRHEIGLEYSAYFDAAQRYLHCLDAARSSVTADINHAIAAYQRLDPVAGK